jgi:Fe-Mn family superoxide dismutase
MLKFKLKDLSYEYSAFVPIISEETMLIHHQKHHFSYVENTNKLIEEYDIRYDNLIDFIDNFNYLSLEVRVKFENMLGGHLNHTVFWNCMSNNKIKISERLIKAFDIGFGSFENFKSEFIKKANLFFGSGWIWLVRSLKTGKLEIKDYKNQNSPVFDKLKPILGIDLWEHAYYIDYRNRRTEYINNWFEIINWNFVEEGIYNNNLCGFIYNI